MKKIISILLALMLTLSCAAVLAESVEEKLEMGTVDLNGSFVIKGLIPEGYTYQVLALNPGEFINANLVKEDDPAAPYLNIKVYLADNYLPEAMLEELDAETIKEIEDSFAEDSVVEIGYTRTAYGTQLMKVTEVGDDPDWIAFYTVYRGYEVELVIHVAEGAEDQTLSDEIAEKAVQFLSDMDFVETEEVQGK